MWEASSAVRIDWCSAVILSDYLYIVDWLYKLAKPGQWESPGRLQTHGILGSKVPANEN